MSFSLNEVEAMAKKAARGAGYPWGLAEEAGKAVRWLCAQGVGGCEALADLLPEVDGVPLGQITPDPDADWSAPGGRLCPLLAGAALSDRAEQILTRPAQAGTVLSPALLFAFAGGIAAHVGRPVTLDWPGGQAVTDGERLCLDGAAPGPLADRVQVRCGGTMGTPLQQASRATPAPAAWDTLTLFAHRTYAPATEESRRKGAG